MKPNIKRSRGYWLCVNRFGDDGLISVTGMGTTPEFAYDDWLWRAYGAQAVHQGARNGR